MNKQEQKYSLKSGNGTIMIPKLREKPITILRLGYQAKKDLILITYPSGRSDVFNSSFETGSSFYSYQTNKQFNHVSFKGNYMYYVKQNKGYFMFIGYNQPIKFDPKQTNQYEFLCKPSPTQSIYSQQVNVRSIFMKITTQINGKQQQQNNLQSIKQAQQLYNLNILIIDPNTNKITTYIKQLKYKEKSFKILNLKLQKFSLINLVVLQIQYQNERYLLKTQLNRLLSSESNQIQWQWSMKLQLQVKYSSSFQLFFGNFNMVYLKYDKQINSTKLYQNRAFLFKFQQQKQRSQILHKIFQSNKSELTGPFISFYTNQSECYTISRNARTIRLFYTYCINNTGQQYDIISFSPNGSYFITEQGKMYHEKDQIGYILQVQSIRPNFVTNNLLVNTQIQQSNHRLNIYIYQLQYQSATEFTYKLKKFNITLSSITNIIHYQKQFIITQNNQNRIIIVCAIFNIFTGILDLYSYDQDNQNVYIYQTIDLKKPGITELAPLIISQQKIMMNVKKNNVTTTYIWKIGSCNDKQILTYGFCQNIPQDDDDGWKNIVIIIVSVVVGLIIIAAIGFILKKKGLFKTKNKQSPLLSDQNDD